MLSYILSLFFGFWLGISVVLYVTFYWIEVIWDLPLTESESASSAHARLQHLVQRAIEEALRLPPLFDYSGLARDQEGRLPEFSPKTYEDLLATAILNKVINRYQHDLTRNNGASSSGVHSGSSSPGSAEGLNESTVSAGRVRSRGRLRNRGKTAAREDSADPSSLEPMSQDDYGLSDSSGRDSEGPIVIEECSVERSVTSTDDEDFSTTYNNPIDGALSNISFLPTNRINFPEYGGDIVDMNESDKNLNSLNETDHKPPNGTLTLNSEIYANNNSWEENWLFQKKKIKTAQSIPVPMLIPNSNTDYRALIGDRDAEDTTDLSEAGSEAEENSTDIKQVLVNSKTIIGGKNPDILLAMIDQDANDDDMNKNGSIGNDDLPKPLISEHKDENDNKTISSKLIDSETNHKFVTADVKYIETFDELFFKREVPEQLESPQISKDNFRHFLRNLENEEPDEQYEVIMDSFVRVPSIMDEEMFATEMVTEATNLDVVDLKEEDPHDSLGNHQQESEYTETVAIPVQRHVDSLRRQHDVSMHNGKNKYEKEDNEIDEINDTPPPLPSTPQPSETKLVESLEDIILVQLVPIPAPNCLDNDENDSIEFTMNGKPFVNDSNANTSFEELVEDIETKENDEKEVPGSVAEREHKKWLNAVPMANNPYSPEAIQNRLNKQNKISVFEHMKTSQDVSPPASPKIDDKNKTTGMPLQVVLGEEITDYKRYGRDYYINESKKSAGARKRLAEMKFGSLPNESNENKNAPLLRSTSETTAPVSFTGSLDGLEASTLHRTITRVCMRSKNASHDFAINPLFESSFTDEHSDQPKVDTLKLKHKSISNSSDRISNTCGDLVYDEDSQNSSLYDSSESLRLNIPSKAEVVDVEFETLSSLRKSGTLRNPNRLNKRKNSLKNLFGGSLRLRRSNEPIKW